MISRTSTNKELGAVLAKVETFKARLLLTIALVFVLSVSYSTSANASSYSWVYNQRGSVTCLSSYTGYNGYCYDRMKNGSKFRMYCWADFRTYRGNYKSKRWFYGQSYNNGSWGYVHSSYIYYQKTVPRCHA